MAFTLADLERETVELAKALSVRFAPPEFIPGCEVKSIADINEYAANNGWIEAVCAQHNQQRVRWKSGETVIVGDFVDVVFFPDRRVFEAWGIGGGGAIPDAGEGWGFDQILRVSTTNPSADYATIAAAITAATAGDIILIDGGTYTETLTINKALTLASLGTIPTIIQTTTANQSTITITANNVNLHRLTIKNGATSGATAICVTLDTGADGVLIDGCTITQSSASPTTGLGIWIKDGFILANAFRDNIIRAKTNGVLIDTGSSINRLGAGQIFATTPVVVNEASSALLLHSLPLFGTDAYTVTAGNLYGEYVNSTGNIIFVAKSGMSGGVWRYRPDGLRIKEATIATAYANCATGDEVHIFPGTYSITGLALATLVHLIGEGDPRSIIITSSDAFTFEPTIAGVTFTNLTINNTHASGTDGVCVQWAVNNIVFTNCIFNKSGSADDAACLLPYGGTGAQIINCTGTSSGATRNNGIWNTAGVASFEVIGGAFSGTQWDILSDQASTITLNGVKMLNNLISVSGGCVLLGEYLDMNNRIVSLVQSDMMINGSLQAWQRGTSFAAIADATYTADKFYYRKTGVMVHTVSQSTDTPTVTQASCRVPFSLLADCTTIDATISAGDYCFISYGIEGYEFAKVAQRPFTVPIWIKAPKTGVYCLAFRSSGVDRSYVAEITVSTTATWELKFVTVAASPTAGTWDYGTGAGLYVSLALACGSTFQTTPNAWQTGNFLGTANQVNACDSTSNDVRIAMVGTQFIPDFEIEQKRCQRYAWVIPAESGNNQGQGAKGSSTLIGIQLKHPTTMRATPTLSHNITGYTAGVPGTTTVGLIDYVRGIFYAITGALTVSLGASGVEYSNLSFTAGTSWDGTTGSLSTLRVGPGCVITLSADL